MLRTFTQLKCRLMPYLYSAAVEAHAAGVPMMRAMMLEFPDDPACEPLDRQYMLGGSLLVAPVLTADGVTDYYLPAGRWTHVMTGEVQEGGRWHRAQHGFLSLPLFVRPGTVLATGPRDDRPDYDFAEGVTFQVYELADGASATCKVHADRGAEALTFTAIRKGKTLEATCAGAKIGSWAVKWVGIASASASEGSVKVEKTAGGIVATPACGARSIRLLLPA